MAYGFPGNVNFAQQNKPAAPFDVNKDPLGRGGSQGLRDILQGYFLPAFAEARKRRGPIESAFNEQTLNPGALYGAASEAAGGRARELFKAGGEVSNLIGQVRGRSINQGFSPDSAYGAENTILRGATNSVADTFAQNAAQLENARYTGLAGAYGNNDMMSLLESLFTGVGSAEQLNLAKNPPRQKFLGIF